MIEFVREWMEYILAGYLPCIARVSLEYTEDEIWGLVWYYPICSTLKLSYTYVWCRTTQRWVSEWGTPTLSDTFDVPRGDLTSIYAECADYNNGEF